MKKLNYQSHKSNKVKIIMKKAVKMKKIWMTICRVMTMIKKKVLKTNNLAHSMMKRKRTNSLILQLIKEAGLIMILLSH